MKFIFKLVLSTTIVISLLNYLGFYKIKNKPCLSICVDDKLNEKIGIKDISPKITDNYRKFHNKGLLTIAFDVDVKNIIFDINNFKKIVSNCFEYISDKRLQILKQSLLKLDNKSFSNISDSYLTIEKAQVINQQKYKFQRNVIVLHFRFVKISNVLKMSYHLCNYNITI